MTSKMDIYICLDEHVQVQKKQICLKDFAKVYCQDSDIKHQVEKTRIFAFENEKEKKEVLSLLYIYRKIEENISDEVTFHSIGASDCLLEFSDKVSENQLIQYLKVTFVSFVLFFGAAFSIMTYDQDSGVADVFSTLYTLFNFENSGNHLLELGYSLGIGVGILMFFHHFEKKGERTPTAMEIQMNKYENDMVESYVKAAERQGKSLEVDSK